MGEDVPPATTVHTAISLETRYGVLGNSMETVALKPKMGATISGALKQFKQYGEKWQPDATRRRCARTRCERKTCA